MSGLNRCPTELMEYMPLSEFLNHAQPSSVFISVPIDVKNQLLAAQIKMPDIQALSVRVAQVISCAHVIAGDFLTIGWRGWRGESLIPF